MRKSVERHLLGFLAVANHVLCYLLNVTGIIYISLRYKYFSMVITNYDKSLDTERLTNFS